MNYNVVVHNVFKRQSKRLSKKYPSLKEELFKLIHSLVQNPEQGVALGNCCYKIRVAIKSKGKGKSGGARLITHVMVANEMVYLLTIYDKSEQADIADAAINELLKTI